MASYVRNIPAASREVKSGRTLSPKIENAGLDESSPPWYLSGKRRTIL
jgi:hypothetical protein